MPILFQGPVGEETLTTAAAAAEASLSTSEEEEARGVPTEGLAPLAPTAAPEQEVTSVSGSGIPSASQRGEGSVSRDRNSDWPSPGANAALSFVRARIWLGRRRRREAGCGGSSMTERVRESESRPCYLLALSRNFLKSEWVAGGRGEGAPHHQRGCICWRGIRVCESVLLRMCGG